MKLVAVLEILGIAATRVAINPRLGRCDFQNKPPSTRSEQATPPLAAAQPAPLSLQQLQVLLAENELGIDFSSDYQL